MADAQQELLLRVRAEVGDALSGMAKLRSELGEVVEEAQKGGASFNDLAVAERAVNAAFGQARTDEARRQFAQLRGEVLNAKDAMGAAASGTHAMASVSSNAQQALFSLTNGLQDATLAGGDFRMMIRYAGNNASQMVMQLGYMASAAKTAEVGLGEALAGALMGPGGIVIGISAALAILPALVDWLSRSGDAAQASADDYKDAADNLIELDYASRQITYTSVEQVEKHLAAARALLEEAKAAKLMTELGYDLTGGTMSLAEAHDVASRKAETFASIVERLTGLLREYNAEAAISAQLTPPGTPIQGLSSADLDARGAGRAFGLTLNEDGTLSGDLDLDALLGRKRQRQRGGRQRTLGDVERDLARTRAVIAALLDLGVTKPAEAADAEVNALAGAIEDALGVTRGETTDSIRQMTAALVEARAAVRALNPNAKGGAGEKDRAQQQAEQEREKELKWFRLLKAEQADVSEKAGVAAEKHKRAAIAAYELAQNLRTANQVGEALGATLAAAVDGLLFGVNRLSDAERDLARLDFQDEAQRLRELWAEGEIGAQRYRLELEVLNERQAEFEASFDRLKVAARSFGEAFRSVLRQIIQELVAAIAKAALLRAFGGGGGGWGGFFQDVLTIFSGGTPGASASASAGGFPSAASASVTPEGNLAIRAGGQVVTVQLRHEFGELRLHNDALAAGVERSGVAAVQRGRVGARAYKSRA